ncbi:MAG TPA: hypothetical protein VF527_08015 [Pyrinomonadaceae bacterium]|jgi:hypothetical protein
MCSDKFVTARLHTDGRYFTCPYCTRVREHPPIFFWYYLIGYGYCNFCGRWTPLENGDGNGIVHIDERGNRRTILRGSKELAEKDK